MSANLLMVLAMPMSASAAFMVLRKWEVWRPAAALAGLIYGFSPYMVGESLGHLSLVFLPLPPLIALTVVSIAKKQGSPLWLGTRLGLLVTAQFLISPEVLAMWPFSAPLPWPAPGSTVPRHTSTWLGPCLSQQLSHWP